MSAPNLSCTVIVLIKEPEVTTLIRCLDSILNSDGEKEVLVVTPFPEKLTPLLDTYRSIKFIKDPGTGIGIARNIGIKAASNEIICFVDSDAIVGKEHFKKIVEEFKKDPETGLIDVGGIIDESLYQRFKPNKLQKLDLLLWKIGRISKFSDEDLTFASGAFMALRKTAWHQVGGFWEWPPYGGDDLDFSFRVKCAGWKVKKVKVRGSIHLPRATLKELFKEQFGWGKGFSCILIKYMHQPEYWLAMKYNRLFYTILPKKLYWMIPILRFIAAPLGGLRTAIKSRQLAFLPYWTFRRYSFLLGLLVGLGTWSKKMRCKYVWANGTL